MRSLLVLCVAIGCTCFASETTSIYQVLQAKPEFRKFYELAKNDTLLRTQLEKRTVTAFVPTSSAIDTAEEWVWKHKDVVASYHVVVMLASKNVFPYSQQSYASGAAPLRLAIRDIEEGGKEYFVNNAKILSDSTHYSEDGNEQLLYVIDKLIEPYVPKNNVPPTALSFLNQPSIYDIEEKLEGFASRVRSENEDELFQRVGQHTYFFPQGAAGSQNLGRIQEMDKWVIRGHVIPNHVLFIRTMGDITYRTEAHNRNLKVEISLLNRTIDEESGYVLYVKSNTLQSYQHHKKGVVHSKIIRPNIPVANGVVHIIEKPLMIISNTIWQILEEESGRFSEFMELAREDGEFMSHLQSSLPQKTLFLPDNKAMRVVNPEKLKEIKENSTALNLFLHLHLALIVVFTEDIMLNRITNATAADNQRKLHFLTSDRNRSKVFTVEGGDVNAMIVEADIGATNGIIHVIDRVLGMPFMTVYEKLRTDPELNRTFHVSHLDDWNWQLRDQNKKYTFFAPNEEAWDYLAREMPTVYKQLTMKEFPHHVHKILDRHLKINHAYTTEELLKYQNIQMIHGVFKVESKRERIIIEWEGERANISRANVKAANGIIHVIDAMMVKRRDMKKSSANSVTLTELLIGVSLLFSHILF